MAPAICLGKFDALHVGHRALAAAAAAHGAPHLVTFTGIAEALGWPARAPLVAGDDRARVLATWGNVAELAVPFAPLRALAPADFVAHLARTVAPAAVVVGEDFRFGRDRTGDVATLATAAERHGIVVRALPPVLIAGEPASSTRVRAALAAGDVATAAAVLGRLHRLLGRVAHGDGRGRALGFPTANVAVDNVVPADGVYAAHAILADGTRRSAAVNIGVLPTVGAGRTRSVEAHLIGFAGDLYGTVLALDLVTRLRDERRFPDLAALRAQVAADIAAGGAACAAAPS